MATREWASLVAGLALAGAGLVAFATASPADGVPATATTSVPAVPSDTAASPAAAAAPAAPVPAVGDLSPAVAVVLARAGYLEVVGPEQSGVAAEVARVLTARGVVLQVPAEPLPEPIPGMGR
jgi:hypothetical protein